MSNLLLIPLEDSVVFPNMSVTLAIDVGEAERVFLVPVHEGEYASVGTVAEVSGTMRLPGGGNAVTLSGLHRGVAGAANTGSDGRLRVEVDRAHRRGAAARGRPPSSSASTAPSSKRSSNYATPTRGFTSSSARSAAPVRSPTRRRTHPTSASPTRCELLETIDVVERLELSLRLQHERLAELQVRRRIREDVESGAQKQQREYILRRQMDSIRKELGEDDGTAAEDYRTKLAETSMPDAVREQVEREIARLERMGDQTGESQMIRTYLDWLFAVPWGDHVGGAARPATRARGARCGPCRPRGREGTDRRVPGRSQAARGAWHRGGQALGRDPDPDRASRHRQDVGRRVDRARAQPRVRAHVARRRPRRGGDPRSPAHVHRCPAGPARARAARRRNDEPGDPARRGRQGRRRLARRPVGRTARGARPSAEPLVPRPLPRRRARPVAGRVHRDRQRRRDDPGAAARPHGSDPLRRLHRRREDSDRPRLPVAAPARPQRACARTRSR